MTKITRESVLRSDIAELETERNRYLALAEEKRLRITELEQEWQALVARKPKRQS